MALVPSGMVKSIGDVVQGMVPKAPPGTPKTDAEPSGLPSVGAEPGRDGFDKSQMADINDK